MQGGVYKIKEKENGHFSTAKIYYTKDEEKALMVISKIYFCISLIKIIYNF